MGLADDVLNEAWNKPVNMTWLSDKAYEATLDQICKGHWYVDPHRQKTIVLSSINTPEEHSGQGRAKALLKRLTDMADKGGFTIRLVVDNNERSSVEELISLYGKFGFKLTGEYYPGVIDLPIMARKPR